MQKLPRVFYYNTTCEMAIGNGLPHYQAPALVSKLEDDLAFLMAYLAESDDWVLMNSIPSHEFLMAIGKAGFDLPRIVSKDEFFNSRLYLKMQKDSFEPWGISPAVLHKVKPHFDSFSDVYKNSLAAQWKTEYRGLFGRDLALSILNEIIEKNTDFPLLNKVQLPAVCMSVKEVDDYIRLHKKVMLKAPWSSSGRGILRLEKPILNQSNIQWIEGTIASQGYVMAEALLNKCIDFSFHFKIDDDGISNLGLTTFLASKNGQYQGSYLEIIPDDLAEEYQGFYNEKLLFELQSIVKDALDSSRIPKHYRGVLGVDALVFKNVHGDLFIQPCVEINLRRNMGTITLALRKNFPQTKGYWQTVFAPKGKLSQRSLQLEKEHPQLFVEGALKQGFLPLTEMNSTSRFASYLILR